MLLNNPAVAALGFRGYRPADRADALGALLQTTCTLKEAGIHLHLQQLAVLLSAYLASRPAKTYLYVIYKSGNSLMLINFLKGCNQFK